jgi:hypothetical protein
MKTKEVSSTRSSESKRERQNKLISWLWAFSFIGKHKRHKNKREDLSSTSFSESRRELKKIILWLWAFQFYKTTRTA